MPKLQSYKRIISSDYSEEDRPLVEQLGGSLNNVIDDHQYALNGKLSLADNLYCTVRDVDLTVDANGGTGNTRIGLNSQVPVIGTEVIFVSNQTNTSIYPTGTPFISFTQINNTLLINNITNLPAGYRWKVRIVAWN